MQQKKYRGSHLIITVILASVLFLALFAGTQLPTGNAEENIETEEETEGWEGLFGNSAEKVKDYGPNNYYNAMKKSGDFIYYTLNDGIYCARSDGTDDRQIAEGVYRLGDVTEDALYFTQIMDTEIAEARASGAENQNSETPAVETPAAAKTPAVETPAVETPAVETPAAETPATGTTASQTPGTQITIGKLSLDEENSITMLLTEETDNPQGYQGPYVDASGTIFCEEQAGENCNYHKYTQKSDQWSGEVEDTAAVAARFAADAEKEEDTADAFLGDYISSYVKNGKIFLEHKDSSELEVYSDDEVFICGLKDYAGNLMITDDGFVYTDLEGFVRYVDYEERKMQILYDPDEGNGFHYAAYDKNGVYGFTSETENRCEIARISWEGEMTILYTADTGSENLKSLSAFGDSFGFIQDEKAVIILP